MAAVPEATYRAALRAIAAFDRRDALPAIGVPVLCIAGAHDRTAPPAVLRGMAARIPHATVHEIAGAGHLAPLEQPREFHRALLDFIDRTFPERTPCTSPAPPNG